MRTATPAKIKMWNPMGRLEKISQKNPAGIAAIIPSFFLESSKRFKRISEIKIRFGIMPDILKWTKKLV